LKIRQNTKGLVLLEADLADHVDEGLLLFMGAMGEVEADNVNAGPDEIAEDGFCVGGRAESGNDLCAALRGALGEADFRERHRVKLQTNIESG
jgi:hypothetical protein